MNLKNINLSDLGKFAASTAVVYTSAFLEALSSAHLHSRAFYQNGFKFAKLGSALCLSDLDPSKTNVPHNLFILKTKLAIQAFFTVGAYKLVDSVFEFDSVHSKAGMSAAAGAINPLVDVVMSYNSLTSNSISKFITDNNFQKPKILAANIIFKAGAAAALAYINHDYSENNESHQMDHINPEFDNSSEYQDLLEQ